MKTHFISLCTILSLVVCGVANAQKYSISYVHNVYNRDAEFVKQVAIETLKEYGLDYTLDDTNHNTVSNLPLHYDNKDCKSCTVRYADLNVVVKIYYKQGRTKIEFTDITYSKCEGLVAVQGSVDDLVFGKQGASVTKIKELIVNTAYSINNKYKDNLIKATRDKNKW